MGTSEAAEWWNRAVVCGCWGLTSMLRVIWWCAESRDLLPLGEGMKSQMCIRDRYTTPCLAGLLDGYDTVSIAGAIDFLQDKYGRRRSTGRCAKSSTRPRLLRLLAN